MNDKTLMVYIGTAEDALKDFMAAWKSGKPAKPVNRLSFESMGGYMKAFTPKRWELLEVLKRNNGQNINQLAQALNRDYKNVHTDIQTLLDLGIVEKDRAGLVSVPWDEIETHVRLGVGRLAA
jgi:predicted transcriptional regulator